MMTNENRRGSSPHAGRVAVFGATGHTGRFVVAELLRRGFEPVLVARDAARLEAMRDAVDGGLQARVASVDNPASLAHAFRDAAAIINCAGPFLDTASPVIEAALRLRVHYLDVTAEQASARDSFERFGDAARTAGIIVAPAMAFYGGLTDLLATAVMQEWTHADTLQIDIALDSWKPTAGTRLTGRRNTARRLVIADGRLAFLADPAPTGAWTFPAPFGRQDVIAMPLSEMVVIARHLRITNANTFINRVPLDDIHNPDTPPPVAADESGRSDQVFVLDVVARKGMEERHAVARGRDIYAVTAPIVVEAAARILDGQVTARGALAAGELFDARGFLEALSPDPLSVEVDD